MAQENLDLALKFAREVDDIWYRVQSLAKVAWFTKPRPEFARTVKEALAAARLLKEPNRVVSSSAWVVRAMTQRSDFDAANTASELVALIENEPNPVRRADALLLLFEAVYPKRELRASVLGQLLSACGEMKSWKQPRIFGDIALILAADDAEAAQRVLELINDEPTRRKMTRMIANQEYLGPHEFFPFYAKQVRLT